jgi:hypothetical protein
LANQVVEVGQLARDARLAELRRALTAPEWTATVAARGVEGGAA